LVFRCASTENKKLFREHSAACSAGARPIPNPQTPQAGDGRTESWPKSWSQPSRRDRGGREHKVAKAASQTNNKGHS